ncbi:sterol desaturase family protein [Dermatobacter hominis]|uniref:sterol desaturase family protein n=1 Tax=Dermatobacter hominis TaxID=2884263 RepID=UPI001D121A27|nr:sterol desaturase family protein [Dermatobacter hominis]UDY34936.1 sterol desaturase family protein [Dermatobacter hominis]
MGPARSLLIGVAAFLVMEPVTALLHRLLFHGPGLVLHRSHHRPNPHGWEANDAFPVVLAALTIVVMAVGTWQPGLGALVAVGAGVTAYGASYALVHDLYIHRRVSILPEHVALLEPLREAHRIHHLYGAAPYGMLAPVVPKDLRARASRTDRDPIGGGRGPHARTAPLGRAESGRAAAPATASLRASGTRARTEKTS